jgi:hypothetical protein
MIDGGFGDKELVRTKGQNSERLRSGDESPHARKYTVYREKKECTDVPETTINYRALCTLEFQTRR